MLSQEQADEQAVNAYNSGYMDGSYDTRITTLQECIDVIEKSTRDYLMVGAISISAKNRILEGIRDLLQRDL